MLHTDASWQRYFFEMSKFEEFAPCPPTGYTHLTGGYDGGQAQYVRTPYGALQPMKDRTEPHAASRSCFPHCALWSSRQMCAFWSGRCGALKQISILSGIRPADQSLLPPCSGHQPAEDPRGQARRAVRLPVRHPANGVARQRAGPGGRRRPCRNLGRRSRCVKFKFSQRRTCE